MAKIKMECLVSTSFVVPVQASPALTKELHESYSALVGLSRKATLATAQKALGSCSSNNFIVSVKGRSRHCLMSCARFLCETYSYSLNEDYCTEIVISGFWVGPDDDDGWGFVEAVINQMT